MLKYKKMLAMAMFGIGLGVSAVAIAKPGAATCKMWLDQCNSGNEQACAAYEAGDCWWWNL